MTPQQVREARLLLGWTVYRLAGLSGVSPNCIISLERESVRTTNLKQQMIRSALEAAGVEFTNGDAPGVKLRKPVE